MSRSVNVIAAPVADPSVRMRGIAPEGSTVAEIVDKMLPGLPAEARASVRVTLSTRRGSIVVDGKRWDRVRPKEHATVIIRVVPGKGALSTLLQIVVTITAVALGQYWGVALGSAWGLGSTGTALLKAGLTIGLNAIGMLAVNALIPPASAPSSERKASYTINGWKNRIEPNAVIPDPTGTHRYAPPFCVPPFATIKGDDEVWITGVFLVGYGSNDPAGGISMTGMKIGDTSLSEFNADNFVLEVREGVPSDAPLSLVPYTTYQENIGVELTRPYPRSDLGKVLGDEPTIETPIVRYSAANATGGSILITFQGGLGAMDDKGDQDPLEVQFRIRLKLVGTEEWHEQETITIRRKKLGEGFTCQHSWTYPSRGNWAVELTRVTDEHVDTKLQSRSTWEALQTIRPEYPINEKKPMALVALHIKATHQLNGTLDSFNLIASRRCKDYDRTTDTWVTRVTSSPASIFRYKLQGLAAARPAPDSAIDLAKLADWHDFCRIKGLEYDRIHDDSANHLERLVEVARAGRASPWHDGRRRTVVIDRPEEIPVDEISMRNSTELSVKRVYLNPPHAFRVTFNDRTNNYEPAERWVRWPGYEGDIELTEQLALPGKTNPDEIYRETMRRMYEVIYRQDAATWMQNGMSRVATRGDHVNVSFPTFDEGQVSGRVIAVEDRFVELDTPVTMIAGKSYAILIRVYADNDDDVGMTVLRSVATEAGSQRTFVVEGDGGMPLVGDAVYFGEAGKETQRMLITQVESGDEFAGYYRAVPAAPEIDTLIDALEIEPWSSLVGYEIEDNLLQPPAPRFTGIDTGVSGTGTAGTIDIRLTAGTGPNYSARFVIEHRLLGAPSWTVLPSIPSVSGGLKIAGVYSNGQHVQIRAKALSIADLAGTYGPVVEVTVGSGDVAIPGALNSADISIGRLLGGAVIMVQTTDDAATTHLQVYHSTTGTVDTSTDAYGSPVAVSPSRSYSLPQGDITRVNLLDNGTFDSSASWSLGSGWSIGSGKATHASGAGGSISQAEAMSAGKYYRIGFSISGRTTGTFTPRLTGGSTITGTGVTTNGSFKDRLQAASGNTTLGLLASTTFDGSIDDVVLYLETSTCLSQGMHYFWLAPLNADGVAGPLAGPFSVDII